MNSTNHPFDKEGLWQHIKSTITPLKKTAKIAPDRKTPSLVKKPQRLVSKIIIKERIPVFSKLPPTQTQPATGGIDRNTARKLRQGKIKIEQRLDLHGMTQKEAREKIHQAIKQAQQLKKRCLLVITGKGTGALHDMAEQIFQQKIYQGDLIHFCDAQPRDGGSGAFYLLLKRDRTLK